MKEVVMTGRIKNVTSLIEAIEKHGLKNALMILERVPDQWLSEDECENSLCFKEYAKLDFNSWQKGRVFDFEKEIRWSWNQDHFLAIYTGPALNLPKLTMVDTKGWEVSKPTKRLLWGKRLASHNSQASGFAYLELQIPRLLYYPIPRKDKKRAALKIVEYRDKTTGQIVHCRFSPWRKTK